MAGEIYKNTRCIEVAGRVFEEVQGEKVTPQTAPFKDGFIPYLSVVAVDKFDNPGNVTEPEKERIIKISKLHGRSYELRFGKQSSVVWSDEFGNLFTALNIKGNNLLSPYVKKSSQEPSGYQVFGLMDSDALVRILRVSRILREHNVDTESLVKVIEPQELPYEEAIITLEDFKGKLLQQVEQKKNGLTANDLLPLSNHLDNSTFVMPVRNVKVPERIEDLANVNNKDEFRTMMKRIFQRVNLVEKISAEREGISTTNVFDVENNKDIERYLLEYLPKKLGGNYGGMHTLGLLHVFPHAGNQTAAGEIVDLDSVKGELTGCNDPSVPEEEKREERASVIGGLQNTLHNLEQKGILKFTLNTLQATDNYYKSYFARRGWEKDILSHLADIDSAFGHYGDPHSHPHAEYYLNLAVKQLGWDYEYSNSLDGEKSAFGPEDGRSMEEGVENLLDNPENQMTADEIIEKYFIGLTKHFKRDTNQRFSDYVAENIEQDFVKTRSRELDEITVKYGQKTAEAVKFLLVDRAYNKLNRDRTGSLDEEISRDGEQRIKSTKDKYKGHAMDYYKNVISDSEHKFDPLMPIWTICAENEFFEGDPTLRRP